MSMDYIKTESQISSKSLNMSPDEQKKLRRAVRYINFKQNEAVHALIDIGKYLLNEFYDNKIEKYRDRAPRKAVSLRKLAEETDLNMSYRSLCNAVNLAIQERKFFSVNSYFSNLSESHKILLLNVRDDSQKLHFAKASIENQWSVRDLRTALIDACYVERQGRIPKKIKQMNSKSQKARLTGLVSPFQKIQNIDLGNLDVNSIPARDRNSIMQSAIAVKKHLEKLIDHLSGKAENL